VKIRAGSLFYNPRSRIGAYRAGFGLTEAFKINAGGVRGPERSGQEPFSSALHSAGCPCTGCTQEVAVSHLQEAGTPVQSQRIQFHQD
jgi:hypothetical protein